MADPVAAMSAVLDHVNNDTLDLPVAISLLEGIMSVPLYGSTSDYDIKVCACM